MSGATTASYAAYAAMAAAAAYSAYSTVQSGKQQQLNANAQAEQAELDAKTERSAAEVQAERIRKLARIQASEANAALAKSGVEVGEGTAININREIYENAEEDAALTIFGGANRAGRMNLEASNLRLAGSQARSNANAQAGATLLSTAGSIASGWKTSAGGINKQGQATPLYGNAAYVRNM